MRRIVLIPIFILIPISGLAQGPQDDRFDFVLTTGYRWGGDISVYERAVNPGDYNVDVTDSGTYGFRLGVALSNRFRVELIANRQDTRFEDNKALFGEFPGGFVRPGDTHVLDVLLDTYHLGFTWDLGSGDYRWYLAGSAGITKINPQLPLPNDEALSMGLGVGVRFEMSDSIAFLLEARGIYIATDDKTSGTYEFINKDCASTCFITFEYEDSMVQTELSAGLLFRF